MKIIHVYGSSLDHSYSKRIGGMEEHFLNLNKKLQPNMYVLYARDPNEISFKKNMNKKNTSFIVLSNKNYFSYLIEYVKFIQKQRKNDNELIIHVHFDPISHMIIVITKLLGIKNIYWTKHSRLMIKKYTKSWFYHKTSSLFVKKIICVSQAVEKELKELDLDLNKTIVIPLGLNIGKYTKLIPTDKKIALCTELNIGPSDFVITIVAQQRPEKRVEVFIKAFADFIRKNNLHDVVGLIVGGGPLEPVNIELAKELGIFEQLRFMGLRHDVDIIYKISHTAGLTSETEGLPFALLEACAMSLPLFGSNAGGIPEVIKDNYNGFLFEVGDYSNLSIIFYKFYKDRPLAQDFGKNSLKHLSDNYNIDICTDRLISCYHNEKR